jgi:hypothetical protein
LLTAPVVGTRKIANDADEWSQRLAALATLGQYDGLTLIVEGGARARYAYNLADDPSGEPAMRSAIDETRRSGATVQAQTTIRLADDRVATAAMVAPLAASEDVAGVLVALRVGRSFAAADALNASGVFELVSLELAREAIARRDEQHRRQAFALYEMARLALFGERLRETLQDVSVLLTGALDHDLAQIWLFGADGTLELSAAYPRDDLRLEQMRPSDHNALAEALHQRRLVRIGYGALRPWIPAETRELIVVPLAEGTRSLGVLLLGRTKERYEDADEELAGVLGRFMTRLLSKTATVEPTYARRPRPRADLRESLADREWEDQPQLTGS